MNRIILTEAHIDELTDIFNNAFAGDFIIDRDIVRQNIFDDENYDPEGCLGITWEGQLAGFIICKYYKVPIGTDGTLPEIGWISCLAVKEEFRKQGIGSRLLTWGEEFLNSRERHTIVLGGDYKRFFAGVPEQLKCTRTFFKNRGYDEGNLYYDLINRDSIITDGYKTNYDVEYREMKAGDEERVKEFFSRCFTGRWGYLVTTYIERYPEKLEDVFLVLDGEKVIGFAKIFDWESTFIGPSIHWRRLLDANHGGLGPIGVDDSYRGQNIGITLLLEALKTLKSRGVGPIVIDATHLVDFYKKLGFVPWIAYRSMKKNI